MGDIFSAIGILLVFATVALDFVIKDSVDFIKIIKPDASKKTETDNYNSKKNNIVIKLVGVLIFYLVLFWLLIPKSVEILKSSEINFWEFNLLSTFYILINFCILVFIILTLKYIIKTLKK